MRKLIIVFILIVQSCSSNSKITKAEIEEIKKETCFDVGKYCTKIGESSECFETDCETVTIYRIPLDNEKDFLNKIHLKSDVVSTCGYWRKSDCQYVFEPNEKNKGSVFIRMEYSTMMKSLIVWKFDI